MLRAACVFVIAVLFASGAPRAEQITQLKLLEPVQRMLEGDARDIYAVELAAGECAIVTIEQHGIDLIVSVLDGSGNVVATIDDDSRKDGRERVSVIADSAGTPSFRVSARYPKNAVGAYTVRVDEIRPATDRDRALVEARRLLTESANLRYAGKFDDALNRGARAIALAEQAVGPRDALVGEAVGEMGTVQRSRGQLRESEQSFQRAIDILTAAVGRENPRTGWYLQHLGTLYTAMEDYARAEPILLEGTAITERTLGEHPNLAIAYMDLSILHYGRGDEDRAIKELQRARDIASRALPPEDFTNLSILNNLGDVLVHRGDYDSAQPYLEQSLAGIERAYGRDSYRVANPLLNLAIVARQKGDFASALRYLQRAYDVRSRAFGAESAETASLLITFGNVYHMQGEYAKAVEAYQRAYDALDRTAGPYHSFTMMAIGNAATAYAAAGQFDEALAYQSKYDARVARTIDFNLAIGSERDRLKYLESTFEKMGRTITLNLVQLPNSAAAADLAVSAILRRKGRVLDAIAEARENLRTRLDGDDQQLLDDYTSVTKKLSQLALSGPRRTAPDAYRKQLDDLERDRDALEGRMAARSAQFRADRKPVSVEAVRAAIPADAALIEFVAYAPFHAAAKVEKDAYDPPHYAAYVIRRDGETAGVDLGPVADIDAAVDKLRGALRDPARTDVSEISRRLDRLVMQPLRSRLATAKQLLIAPDGALNLIPFEALVDERGRFQVERYAMSYLGSGRDILRMQVTRASTSPPVVIADPAFGEPPVTKSGKGPVYFAPLDGTRQEAEAIGRLLPGAVVLTGSRASKTALEQTGAPSILHIASHAFFLPENGAPAAAAVADTRSMTTAVQSPNPLLRSGIALAGANLSRPGDSGILTALEASTLNLWGTRLVTLSACDTGVGDVKTGEGVYGLRRAFFVAGSESLVMSLWPISDQVTRSVMTRYYAGLARGEGRAAALRRVQLAMLADKKRNHAFYWAGFIEAGDWTPIR